MAPILGVGKRLPKWEPRVLCFLEGLAWNFDAGNDNLQPQTFEF